MLFSTVVFPKIPSVARRGRSLFSVINVKNKVYKNGYRRRIAHLKPQKFTVCNVGLLFHHYSASSILRPLLLLHFFRSNVSRTGSEDTYQFVLSSHYLIAGLSQGRSPSTIPGIIVVLLSSCKCARILSVSSAISSLLFL